MTEHTILTIHMEPPDAQESIPLKLKLIKLSPNLEISHANSLLKLPFPLAKIPFLLRALNARQYPDYPKNERLINTDEERDDMVAFLRSFNLWDDGTFKPSVVVNVHKKFGLLLGDALQAVPDFKAFHQTLYEAGTGEIVFSFHSNALALAALPWEVTYMSDTGQPMLLTRGAVLGCTRIITSDNEQPALRLRGERLRVLTLAPHAGMDEAGRAFEQLARSHLREQLRNLAFDIEALPRVTMRNLYDRLKEGPSVDILDFYGHGIPTLDGTALLMDGENGGIVPVSAEVLQGLASLLPPVVVLHACQSAHMKIDSPLASIAVALSVAGVRAVLAMQLTAQMPAVTHYIIPRLYEMLAAGKSLQMAVAEVRRALHTVESTGTSWYLPALYLRQKEMHPFVLYAQTEIPPNPFAGPGALRNAKRFVGRARKVRLLWDRLKAGGSLSIVGPAESGKSSILKLIAEEAQTRVDSKVEVIQLPISSNLEAAKMDLVTSLGGEHPMDLIRLLRNRHLILLLDDLGELEQGNEGLRVRTWIRSLAHAVINQDVQLVATCKRPISELFGNDRPTDSSTLAGTLADIIELESFDMQEAQLFIVTALVGTPFKIEQFVETLDGSLMPGHLQKSCRDRYDVLSEERNW